VWTDIGNGSRDYGRVLLAKLGKEAGGEGGVDWIAAAYRKKGSKAPVKDALAEAARFEWEERHPGAKAPMTLSRQWLATVKRYNLEGLAGLARRDRAFAREAK
jgi:hypothetical protein